MVVVTEGVVEYEEVSANDAEVALLLEVGEIVKADEDELTVVASEEEE